jgi:FAD/FMN-containing dehydrogenase
VVRASDTENPELFWALRGGSGNFGVVTSFELKLHDVGPEIIGGPVAWHAADAPEVLRFYRELTANAPRELSCVAILRLAPPAPWLPKEVHGKPIVMVLGVYTGPAAEGEKLVAPIKALGKPVADICVRRPYAQMQSLLDATQPKGRRYYWKSEYLPRIEPAACDTLLTHFASIPSPHSALIFFPIGGALNELPADHSPAGNRDAHFICNITSQWERKDDDDVNIAWARTTHQAVKPFSTGGVYVNFLTEEEGADRIKAAYGAATLDRLGALKRKYDPQGLFRHTKAVT